MRIRALVRTELGRYDAKFTVPELLVQGLYALGCMRALFYEDDPRIPHYERCREIHFFGTRWIEQTLGQLWS